MVSERGRDFETDDPGGCPFFRPTDVVGEEPLKQAGLGTSPNQLRDGVRCQGEWHLEELAVVALQAAAQPGARVQSLAKLHHNGGQLAQRLPRPDHGMVRKAALALLQHSPQLPGKRGTPGDARASQRQRTTDGMLARTQTGVGVRVAVTRKWNPTGRSGAVMVLVSHWRPYTQAIQEQCLV